MSAATPYLRIGDAARLSGVSAANIRYYEKQGLLPQGIRAENSYRLYSYEGVHRLRFVRLCRTMDMSLDEVRVLLALDAHGTDHEACIRIDEHLQHVRTRLAELHALEAELQALRSRCDGAGAQCQVMEALHEKADAQPMEPVTVPMHVRAGVHGGVL